MQRGSEGNPSTQQAHPRILPSAPYHYPQAQARHPSSRATRYSSRLSRSGPFVVPNPPVQLTSLLLPANNPQAAGTVSLAPHPGWRKIKQITYAPTKACGDFTPAGPVEFSVNGVLGVSLSQAVAEKYAGLDGRDNGVSAFEKGKVTCRLQFIHCDPYGRTINTRHHDAGWTAIKRCKLAKEIGRKVKAYIEAQELQHTLDFERIYLTRFIHVSKGSWQPELYYGDPVAPGPSR